MKKLIKECMVDFICNYGSVVYRAIRKEYGAGEVLKYWRWWRRHLYMSFTLYSAFDCNYFGRYVTLSDGTTYADAETLIMFTIYRAIKYGDAAFDTLKRLDMIQVTK